MSRPACLLLLVLGASLLAPVWVVRFVPVVDFPNHLARAFVLAHLNDPAYRFSEFYAADWHASPYLALDVILVGLQRALTVETAGRLVLSLSLLALPLAVWFFLRQANPGQDHLGFWSLLIVYNHFLLTGMINMQLSVALCFCILGVWLRFLAHPGPWRWLLLLLAVTGLYGTHLLGFAVTALAVGIVSLRTRLSGRQRIFSALLFLPGFVLFSFWRASTPESALLAFPSFRARLAAPFLLLENYLPALDLASALVLLGCVFLACWRNPEFRWNHRWLDVCVALATLFLTLPVIYGRATFVYQRLAPFLFLAALAAIHVGRRARWLAPVAVLLFIVRMAALSLAFASQQPLLASLDRSIDFCSPHARVLPLVAWKGDSQAHKNYSQFWAYGVIHKGWYSPYIFHDPGVHPLRLRYQPYYPSAPFNLPTVYREAPNWGLIQRDYDFVWAFNVPAFHSELSRIGVPVFEEGDLRVYQMVRPPFAAP
ncbi:MAG: hypothetical protein ACRD2Q_04885 [Terriglobales bacterium]